jgi:ATP-dependent protease HslVU (ClpYQ) peptidase subunit
MTCIVGIEQDGYIIMGGDASCNDSEGDGILIQKEPKVFKRSEYVIGFAGSFRVGAILRYIAKFPKVPNRALDRMMVTEFSAAIRNCFKEEDLDADWTALVGIRDKLYCIEPDFHIWRHKEPYAAIGSGAQVALGALYALSTDLTPRQRVEIALKAAEKFVGSVRGPWTLASTQVSTKVPVEVPIF